MAHLTGFGPNDRDTLVGFAPDPNVVMGEPVPMPAWVVVILIIAFATMCGLAALMWSA